MAAKTKRRTACAIYFNPEKRIIHRASKEKWQNGAGSSHKVQPKESMRAGGMRLTILRFNLARWLIHSPVLSRETL